MFSDFISCANFQSAISEMRLYITQLLQSWLLTSYAMYISYQESQQLNWIFNELFVWNANIMESWTDDAVEDEA